MLSASGFIGKGLEEAQNIVVPMSAAHGDSIVDRPLCVKYIVPLGAVLIRTLTPEIRTPL